MRWEFEQRLFERWPTWFSPKGDIPQTGMTLVFRHDDGWFNIPQATVRGFGTTGLSSGKETLVTSPRCLLHVPMKRNPFIGIPCRE